MRGALVNGRDTVDGARTIRVHSITRKGMAALRRWLAESPVDPPALEHHLALRIFLGLEARNLRVSDDDDVEVIGDHHLAVVGAGVELRLSVGEVVGEDDGGDVGRGRHVDTVLR
jgi:hypothetical protein